MKLELRIEKLKNLLILYSIEDIHKKYKDYEMNNVIEYFHKYPDVKYSPEMKKRLLNEAKRKKISKSNLEYLKSILELNISFNEHEFEEEFNSQTNEFLTKLLDLKLNTSNVKLIFLEHDYKPNSVHCYIYGKDAFDKWENDLYSFETKINFTSVWGFLNKNKFVKLCEHLECVDIDEEGYDEVIFELFKLRSYKLIKNALQSNAIKSIIKNDIGLKDIIIEIGEHDNWRYEIYNS